MRSPLSCALRSGAIVTGWTLVFNSRASKKGEVSFDEDDKEIFFLTAALRLDGLRWELIACSGTTEASTVGVASMTETERRDLCGERFSRSLTSDLA